MAELDSQERAKKAAAVEAARMAPSGSVIGLGTGSTAAYVIEELGRRAREEGVSFVGIPTSYSAEALARRHGIPIRGLDDVARVDMAIDGADEVDGRKNLIKGLGGAHTREKIVDSFADLFVVVVDDTKLVERLGIGVPVPLEVLPVGVVAATRRVKEMGGTPQLRMAGGRADHAGPFITEQGNMILDVRFQGIDDPKALEGALNSIPGVVENGLFAGRAHLVVVGSLSDGTVRRLD